MVRVCDFDLQVRVCDFVLVVTLVLLGDVPMALTFMLLTALEDVLDQGEPPHYKLTIR